RGTEAQALVDAAFFAWRIERRWHPDADLGQSLDVAALVKKAETLIGSLDQAAPQYQSPSLDATLHGLTRDWQIPQLDLRIESQHLPGETIQFAYAATGFEHITFTLHRFTPEQFTPFADPRLTYPPSTWYRYLRDNGRSTL